MINLNLEQFLSEELSTDVDLQINLVKHEDDAPSLLVCAVVLERNKTVSSLFIKAMESISLPENVECCLEESPDTSIIVETIKNLTGSNENISIEALRLQMSVSRYCKEFYRIIVDMQDVIGYDLDLKNRCMVFNG